MPGTLVSSTNPAGFRFLQDREMLGFDEHSNLARQIGANTRKFCQIPAAGNDFGSAARKVLDSARGFAVGADPKRIGSLDLEKISELIESTRNLASDVQGDCGPL
jgi:hypothetical protein